MRRSESAICDSPPTPTDASHVLGDQTTHDPEIARLGAAVARRRDRYGNDIAETPIEIRRSRRRRPRAPIAEALLAAALDRDGLDDALAQSAPSRLRSIARLACPIGIGSAPSSSASVLRQATYHPAIGEVLGTEVEVLADADVANAIGAVVAGSARAEVPVTAPRRGVYRIHAGGDPEIRGASRGAGQSRGPGRAAAVAEVQAAGAKEFEVEVTGPRRSSRSMGDRCSSRGRPSRSQPADLTSAGPSLRRHPDERRGPALRSWHGLRRRTRQPAHGRSRTPAPSVPRRMENATA